MIYKNCGFCNFKVSEKEKYCPNCGFKNPWKIKRKWELEKYDEDKVTSIRSEGKMFKILSVIFSGIFTINSALFILFHYFTGFSLVSFIPGLLALVSGFCASGFLIYYRTAFELKNKRNERYLINEEKMINRRITEIIEKKEKIQNVQQRIRRSDGKKDLERTYSMLSDSDNHLNQYKDRFKKELKKIQLIRWRNKFRPIFSEWHKPDYEEGEKILDDLDIIISEGKKLLYSWSTDAGNYLATQIKKDLDILHNLQKSLLNRQAQLSIKDIRPIETEQIYTKQAASFQSYLEKSTENLDVHSFFKASEELEDEYIRFQSEKDVIDDTTSHSY